MVFPVNGFNPHGFDNFRNIFPGPSFLNGDVCPVLQVECLIIQTVDVPDPPFKNGVFQINGHGQATVGKIIHVTGQHIQEDLMLFFLFIQNG